MAVVEMSKINAVAMSYDRDKILNALHKTQAVEIKLHGESENTTPLECDGEALRERLARGETTLEALTARVAAACKLSKEKNSALDEVEISYSQFISMGERICEVEEAIEKLNSLFDEERELATEETKLKKLISSAKIYSRYLGSLRPEHTAHTLIKLGTLPTQQKQNFEQAAQGIALMTSKFLSADGVNELVAIALHKSAELEANDVLQSVGFSACPFDEGVTGEELYNSLEKKQAQLRQKISTINKEILAFSVKIPDLKVYCDFLGFELEKATACEKLRKTQTTFLLEAYLPKDSRDEVAKALEGVSGAIWYGFSEPADDEVPPTLLKNNKVIKNFEAVTDMYSAVNYKEFDPNTIMAFFYSLFLGFIMGDVLYGLLMIVFGGFVYVKSKRETVMKKLSGVFVAGGFFAIFWGFLFNSFLGMAALPYTVMPDAMGGRYTLLGIKIPSVLVISMLIGMVQLLAGYACRAVQCWRRGDILDGIFDGVAWSIFMLGAILAVVGFVEEYSLPVLSTVGGIIVAASLAIAMLTAGRKEKFFGKFTKGFGAVYGVIGVLSDVLSYARLYGLMLSGAVIAQIISGFAVTGYNGSTPFLFSGNPVLIVLGVFLLVAGHLFNLAIGLLGAYIHDARLQYVEFYGRFFEGEGEFFTPFGSKRKYVYLTD